MPIAKDAPKLVVTRSVVDLCSQLSKQLAREKREGFSVRAAADAAGVSSETLLLAAIISLILFVWAIYALIMFGPHIPMWALVLGIVFLFVPPGPLVTLLLVYATRGKNGRKRSSRRSSRRSSSPRRSSR